MKKENENVNSTEIEKELQDQNTIPIIYGSSATLPTYTPYPQWLNKSGLSPTARVIYAAIYDRAVSLSLKNHKRYTNDKGHLFVIYTNDDLVNDCGIKLSALKSAKNILKEKGYIFVEPIEHSSAVRIYPLFPKDAKTHRIDTTKKTYDDTSNSSFETDEYFGDAIRKSLGEDAYRSLYPS